MFAKVFASLWEGTLCGQAHPQLVFIYLLAHADMDGNADIHPRKIAMDCGLTEPEVRDALLVLEGPDPESRSKELDGARLERIDEHRPWGWNIVNYLHYRTLQDADTIRAQTNARVKKHRESKKSVTVTDGNGPKRSVTDGNASKRHVEVDVEVEEEESKTKHMLICDERVSPIRKGLVKEWGEAFDEHFWPIYPRKVAKEAARRAFGRIVPAGEDREAFERLLGYIVSAVKHYVRSEWDGWPPDKIPYPATWINQRRYTDVIQGERAINGHATAD